jgi:hypothetical protein
MSFFQIIKPWSALKNSAPRFAVAVGLLITSVLMGCGGGGSSSGSSSGSSDSGSNTPTSQVNLGVYTTSISNLSGNKDLTLIINSHSASSTNGLFYALQFNSSAFQVQQPDIFSGSIAGIGNTTASISSLTEFSTDLNTLKSGAASFSFPTQDKLKVDVTPQSGSAIQWSDATSITLDTTNSLVGTWTGNLYYPTAASVPLTIAFTSQPTFSDPNNLVISNLQFSGTACNITNGNATPSPSSVNLYNLSMSIANATGCVLRDDIAKPGLLTGVAYVTTSPVAGKTKRLQWVAITSEGRGLSFRADR